MANVSACGDWLSCFIVTLRGHRVASYSLENWRFLMKSLYLCSKESGHLLQVYLADVESLAILTVI